MVDALFPKISLKERLHMILTRIGCHFSRIANADAQRFLMQGVLRRLLVIRHNTLALTTFKPDNPNFLDFETSTMLTMHANSLYLHIHGLFDNLAWAIAYSFPVYGVVDEDDKACQRRVGLFKADFIGSIPSVELVTYLNMRSEWYKLLKELRDPIAHRLPMYAPPSRFTEEDVAQYHKLHAEALAALTEHDFDEHARLRQKQRELGTYVPCLCHSLRGSPLLLPLKEQVEQDVSITADIIELAQHLWPE